MCKIKKSQERYSAGGIIFVSRRHINFAECAFCFRKAPAIYKGWYHGTRTRFEKAFCEISSDRGDRFGKYLHGSLSVLEIKGYSKKESEKIKIDNIDTISVQVHEVDEVLRRIRLALQEGMLTIDSLKIYPDIRYVAEKAVRYLEEVGMVSVNPASREIIFNKNTPYGSFEEAFRYYMPLWTTSLEAFSVKDPERFGRLKNLLRSMPADNIRKKRLITLFREIFEEEDGFERKISEIRCAVRECSEMSICDITPYKEDLIEEMELYVLLFRREPTKDNILGVVCEADAIEYFDQAGYGSEDVKSVLNYFCELKILREDRKSGEKRYEVIDTPKIILGNLLSEKKNTILDRKIKSVLG